MSSVFWDIMSCKSFARSCFMLVCCLAYSLTLKIEATCSTKTSVDFQRATLHYNLLDRTLHNHCCESLKSYILSHINIIELLTR
jgi:hypothetical protein